MPRFTGKTYGRKDKSTESSKAFDDVVNSKVTGAKARWGVTSFTSMRGTDNEARKRKIEETEEDLQASADDGGDSAFDDPFNFESEDDGPTQPKRGMGFKANEKPVKPGQAGKVIQKSRGSKLKKDENNDEKDTMKQAPTKTYSKPSRTTISQQESKVNDKSKQLSMDKFATKLSSNTNTNKVFKITLKNSNRTASNNESAKNVPKKFFTSSQKSNIYADDISNQSSTPTEKGSELFESASDFEYDSDELANLESGDPEIIFNSPQRRRRDAEKRKRDSVDEREEPDSNGEGLYHKDKNDVKQKLFSDCIDDDSNLNKKAKTIKEKNNLSSNVEEKQLTASELFDRAMGSNQATKEKSSKKQTSASELFDIAIKKSHSVKKEHSVTTGIVNEDSDISSKTLSASELFDQAVSSSKNPSENSVEPPRLSASELFDIAIKKSETVKKASPKKEKTVSDLLSNVVLKSKPNGNEGKRGDSTASELFDQVVKSKTVTSSSNESRGKREWKPISANVFDDSDDEVDEEEKTVSLTTSGKNNQLKSNQETTSNSKKVGSKTKNKKTKSKSSNLFEESEDEGNDTDDVSESPLKYGANKTSYNLKNQGQWHSLDSRVASPSKFFPELKRSVSVESSGSNCSGERMKKSSSLCNKLLSMEGERGKKKEPIVRRLLTSPKKGSKLVKASYNARSWHAGQSQDPSQDDGPSVASGNVFDDFDDNQGVKVTRDPGVRRLLKKPSSPYDDEITALKVHKEHKELFTVVRQVKQAHECHEHGENQDFNDELEYIMDGLKEGQPISVRCLSCLNMTTKCAQPSFRMHLRAHGTFDKVFSALHDAFQYPSLALCTASVLYLLSRDRFTMDLEKSTLTLMLRLLSTDSQEQSPCKNNAINREYQQVQTKLEDIFSTIKTDRNVPNPDLDVESITTGHLTMESLLSLTSKKAGDWFKEELRTLGGLDHIIKTVSDCTDDLDEVSIEPSETALDQLRKIERCLRVLENVTYLNSENQNYLVSHKSCLLVKALYKTFSVCENCLTFNPVEEIGGKINKECIGYNLWTPLLAVLRVLLNLTHDNAYTSTKVGQEEGLIKKVLICLLRIPQFVPYQQRFDLLVLSLGLLINVVEHCEHNRDILIETKAVCPFDETSPISKLGESMESLEAMSKLFMLRYEAAKRIEIEHDEELEERERLQQERTARANRVGPNGSSVGNVANKSGEWKHSESGLEWVVLEETEEERIEKELQQDSDSDLDVEVMPNPSQDEEENFTKALHRAGKHMEDCILAAYVALLLGCTIQGNMDHIDRVRDCLPEGDFEPMIRMLRKFLGFMNFTATSAVSQSSGSKSISRIIEVLEAC